MFACIRGGGGGVRCEPSKCMVLSSAVGSKPFSSKMLTYKSTYFGAKINIMPPGSFAFSHIAQGKLGSRFSALSKALIIF